jgi:hypothetical protein
MEAILDLLTVSSMGDITSNSWTSFFVIFVILLAAIFIVVALYYFGKRGVNKIDPEEKRYADLYHAIQFTLSLNSVCENNYWYILKNIDYLKALPHKNAEQTEVLNNRFLIKYSSVRDEIDSRDEFDPGQVFKK